MATPVIMPKLEMSQETATIIEWLKLEGDQVENGEPLFVVETDKVTIEIESPAAGILSGIRYPSQQVVPVTEIIAYVLLPGEEVPAADLQPVVPRAEAIVEKKSKGRATPVARRLAEAHGVDVSSLRGTGTGLRITREDVEAALATEPGPMFAEPSNKVRATPAARRVARERGVDLGTVTGTGPRGRVQAADVPSFVQDPSTAAESATDLTLAARAIPLRGIRRTIAERMTFSYQTAPHITLTVRVVMDSFEETRAQLNAKAEATGQAHISATALIVKAVSWTLTRHPWLNSTLRDETIHLLPEINIGIAVSLVEGLIVPTVRQADRKSVSQIAAEVNDLSSRARNNQLAPADVADGTFTVTHLGPFGIEPFTAIINPPQAAILAVGTIQKEVVVDAGDPTLSDAPASDAVTVRPVMRLTLSADHRVVDGAVAAHFMRDLREGLETPALLLW